MRIRWIKLFHWFEVFFFFFLKKSESVRKSSSQILMFLCCGISSNTYRALYRLHNCRTRQVCYCCRYVRSRGIVLRKRDDIYWNLFFHFFKKNYRGQFAIIAKLVTVLCACVLVGGWGAGGLFDTHDVDLYHLVLHSFEHKPRMSKYVSLCKWFNWLYSAVLLIFVEIEKNSQLLFNKFSVKNN